MSLQYITYSNPNLESINTSISDIKNCLSILNMRFSNLEIPNINLKDLYYYTDELILNLYIGINNNPNKDNLNKIKKLVEIIKTNYNEVSITFNNIDKQDENKETGYILLLNFWLNNRIAGFIKKIKSL